MADTVDEDYRFETLPHAYGKDRRDMVERKLKQLYRSTPFFGASLAEREEGKRRDDRYLFAALTNPAVFDPWLRILIASGLPIAGHLPGADGEHGTGQETRAQRDRTCCWSPNTRRAYARPS